MKQIFICLSIIICFFCMLIFPDTVFTGASNGLLLWFNTVLPTLLPFLIISGLLTSTYAIHLLAKFTFPLFHYLFGVSKYGSFAVLCGFLCGYPMGAKVTADLLLDNKITDSEAKYLLSFCNNTSPMFIISYVMHQNLNAPHLIFTALFILFLSPFLCSLIFRHFYHFPTTDLALNTESFNSSTTLIDKCIMKSFETITKIGGYIILFSILVNFLSSVITHNTFLPILFLSFLEITTGVSIISQCAIPFYGKFICTMALISFGGWCSIMQTQCLIADTKLPVFPYIIEKLITTLVTSLLAYCITIIY